MSDFNEIVEMVKNARYDLSHGDSYNELGAPLYDVAEQAIEGLINVLRAVQEANLQDRKDFP